MKPVRTLPPVAALLFGLLAALLIAVPAAYADGHAGLVIENGDGSVDTYCVAFQGDSITGADLLAKAGVSVVQFNGAVCAVGNQEGCFQPHDYASCYCQSYPPTNTYWSFFTQKHDQGWVYSALGYQTARSGDGDMQAWHWGVGSPGNAPLPVSVSFAQVCGAVLAPTATPVVLPPTATPTPIPATAPASNATPLPTVVPMTPGSPTATASTAASTISPSPGAATPTVTAAKTASPTTPAITNHGAATATPAPAPAQTSSGGNSGSSSLLAFGGVAALLVIAIAAAVIYRRRHGQ